MATTESLYSDPRLPGDATPPEFGHDPAQESLVRALRSSFNILRLIMVLLVIAYFASGIFQVQSGEQGLIVRLGRLNAGGPAGKLIYPSGTHFALPDPFDEKIHLSGMSHDLKIDSFVFSSARKSEKPLAEVEGYGRSLKPGVDGAMFTGDRNLAHGRWQVTYRIGDGAQFVENVGESIDKLEPLLQRLAETAIIRSAGHRRVEEITRSDIANLTAEVKKRVNAELDRLGTGVVVDKVLAETIEPLPVREAFLRATQAQNEMLSEINKAQQKASETLSQAAGPHYPELVEAIREYGKAQVAGAPEAELATARGKIEAGLDKAEGDVRVTLRNAQTEASTTRDRLVREYEEFKYFLEAYRKYPTLAVRRRWNEMITTVLSNKQNEIFYLPSAANVIDIFTNRDPLRQLEAERERFMNRNQPPSER